MSKICKKCLYFEEHEKEATHYVIIEGIPFPYNTFEFETRIWCKWQKQPPNLKGNICFAFKPKG